jgi:ferric hydroxamate transport system substrate-binding protein
MFTELGLPHMHRRTFMAGLAAGLLQGACPLFAAEAPRIVSLDYGLSSTLLSLGVVPAGIADLADWHIWVVEPEMPPSVVDLGAAMQVNFEVLAALKPDLILTTPYLEQLKPKLETVAPVLQLDIYAPDGGDILPKAIAATRKLGAAIGRTAEAEDFIGKAEATFDACSARVNRAGTRPLALVNLLDARHARIYSSPGLYDNVLARIGIPNAWTDKSNYWGFDTIGIEDLSKVRDPEARLIIFEPVPPDALPTLAESPLWNALPFSRPGGYAILPGALMFGMVNEAVRFAGLVTDYLETVS